MYKEVERTIKDLKAKLDNGAILVSGETQYSGQVTSICELSFDNGIYSVYETKYPCMYNNPGGFMETHDEWEVPSEDIIDYLLKYDWDIQDFTIA